MRQYSDSRKLKSFFLFQDQGIFSASIHPGSSVSAGIKGSQLSMQVCRILAYLVYYIPYTHCKVLLKYRGCMLNYGSLFAFCFFFFFFLICVIYTWLQPSPMQSPASLDPWEVTSNLNSRASNIFGSLIFFHYAHNACLLLFPLLF